MKTCRSCAGLGRIWAFVTRTDGRCGGMERVACPVCRGSGKVPPDQEERIREGERRREDRVARGLKLHEEAKRLGISAVELSDIEHGRTPRG